MKDIKRLLAIVFLCTTMLQPLGFAISQKTIDAAVVAGQPTWILERLNIDRIKKYAVGYQQQLKRSDTCQKILLFSGGVVTAGVFAWICLKIFGPEKEKPEQEIMVSIPPGPEITEQEYRRAMLALKREITDDNKRSLSFWGSIRQGVNDGAAIAFYSFIGSIVLTALSSTWKKAGRGLAHNLGLFSPKEQIRENEQLLGIIGRTLGDIIPEYEQACSHALELGVSDVVSWSFVTFLEREIVKQHAAFIQALEEALAFLSELQQYRVKDKKVLLRAFDDQIKIFLGVLDSYTDALERMLNASLDKDKLTLCKKIALISKQIYYQADHLIEECKNLALAA
jgi:hypothetical protein